MSIASLESIQSLDGTTVVSENKITLEKTIAIMSNTNEYVQIPVEAVKLIGFLNACFEALDQEDEKVFIPCQVSAYTLEKIKEFYTLSYDKANQKFDFHAILDMNPRLRNNDLRKSSRRWHFVLQDWPGYTDQNRLDRARDPAEPVWAGYNEEQRAKRRECLANGEEIRTPLPIDYSGFRGISEEMNTWVLSIPPGKIIELIIELDKIMENYLVKLMKARLVCYYRESTKEDEFEGVNYNGPRDPVRVKILQNRLRIREFYTPEPKKTEESKEEQEEANDLDPLFEF